MSREAQKNGQDVGEALAALALSQEAAKAAKPRVKPTKSDVKRIKQLTADKRQQTGEECWTDDELEAAGFLLDGEEE